MRILEEFTPESHVQVNPEVLLIFSRQKEDHLFGKMMGGLNLAPQ